MSGVQHESVPEPRGAVDPAVGPRRGGGEHDGERDGDGRPADLTARVVALEHEVAHLEAALETRTRIGTAIGLLAERHGTTTERAWSLLTRLSNHTNNKVQEVARLLVDVTDGSLDAADVEAVGELARSLPRAVAALGLGDGRSPGGTR